MFRCPLQHTAWSLDCLLCGLPTSLISYFAALPFLLLIFRFVVFRKAPLETLCITSADGCKFGGGLGCTSISSDEVFADQIPSVATVIAIELHASNLAVQRIQISSWYGLYALFECP